MGQVAQDGPVSPITELVEGARLGIVSARERLVGSNPTLSATTWALLAVAEHTGPGLILYDEHGTQRAELAIGRFGGAAFTLQKLLGHSDLAMTRRYCEVSQATRWRCTGPAHRGTGSWGR